MADRRAPAAGAGKPAPQRPSLIQYADPRSFAQGAEDTVAPLPAASASAAGGRPPHRRLLSDLYPVADADADPSTLARSPQNEPAQDYTLTMQGSPGADNEDEAELALGSEEEGDEGASSAPPSGVTSPVKGPSLTERAGKALLRELDVGSAAVISSLRASEDQGPLVEDHLLESIDYDKDEDYVNEDSMEKRSAIHQHFTLFMQFLMTVAIAFVTAMIMYVVSHAIESFHEFKVESVLGLLEEREDAGGYFTFLGISMLFVIIAATLVSIGAPSARGGGVPYVLAYLNGTNVMEYFSLRIVAIKSAALIFTISGGLTQGMEGPFVFIGAGVAAILNSGMDRLIPFFPRHSSTARILRSIREERIFISGGVAAGLAVAFDAPIAGVIFALEGATAFLSAPVVLRIFGCAMFASFFNNLGHTDFSQYIKNHNLLQVSNSGTPSAYAWTLLEVFPFILVALVGGVAGAYATKMNIAISKWRHHHMQGTTNRDVGKQILEAAIFCFLTVSPFFALPYIFGCRPKHELCDVFVSGLPTRCQQAHCPEGQYSEAASIVYATANQIAALLFDRSLSWEAEFHVGPLLTYGLLYWVLVSLLYGAYIPGGLFVPSIVVGGLYGRVIGIGVKALGIAGGSSLAGVNPGVYSLLGAAAMLGGFTRLALPVVIMLVELTGDATYLLPMMLCSALGKFTSDAIEPPLYPQHMAMEKLPSLTDKINPIIAKLTAKDIMLPKEKCQTMCTVERLSTIKDMLRSSRRIVFPLTTPAGSFAGLVLRRNVMFCITHAPTYSTAEEALAQRGRNHTAEMKAAEKHMQDWRSDKYDQAHTITRGSAALEDAFINLTPYMDAGCMTARTATPAKRLAALFRRVGLSHLCITDKNNHFQGLITRRALIQPPAAGTAAAPVAPSPMATEPPHEGVRRRHGAAVHEGEEEHKA